MSVSPWMDSLRPVHDSRVSLSGLLAGYEHLTRVPEILAELAT
jgi:hypothetical protein